MYLRCKLAGCSFNLLKVKSEKVKRKTKFFMKIKLPIVKTFDVNKRHPQLYIFDLRNVWNGVCEFKWFC